VSVGKYRRLYKAGPALRAEEPEEIVGNVEATITDDSHLTGQCWGQVSSGLPARTIAARTACLHGR